MNKLADMSNKIVNGLTWSFAEKILTDITDVVVSITLARFIFPSEYGYITFAQIFINFSSIFITCGLSSSFIQSNDIDEEQTSTLFYLNLIIGFIFYIILFLFAPLIEKRKKIEGLAILIRILGIKIPLASIYSMQHAYIKKRMEFKKFFFSSLFGTITAGIVGTILAINGYGVWALVAHSLIDQIIDCIIVFFSTRWLPRFRIRISKTKELIKFGIKILISELIGRTYEEVKPLIIAMKYTTEDLVFNSKGKKYGYMPITLINSPIERVLLPALINTKNNNNDYLDLVDRIIRIQTFVMSPMMMGIAATAATFVPLLLTSKWNGCVPYIQIYCIIYMISPICSIDEKIYESRGRADLLIRKRTYCIICEMMFIVASLLFFDEPIALTIGLLVGCVFDVFISTYLCKKEIDYGLLKHLKSSLPSFLSSVVMGIIVSVIGSTNQNLFLKLTLQIICGVLVYLVISIVTQKETIKDIVFVFMREKKDE